MKSNRVISSDRRLCITVRINANIAINVENKRKSSKAPKSLKKNRRLETLGQPGQLMFHHSKKKKMRNGP